MKRATLLFVLLTCSFAISFAQTSSTINDTAYFGQLYKAGHERMLTKEALMAAQPRSIPVNLADTLKKYDWMLIQNVDPYSGWMNNFFAAPPVERVYYNVMRYDTAVSRHLLTLQQNSTVTHDFQTTDGQFKGVLFRNDSSFLLMNMYEKRYLYGADPRQYEMRRIVSYTEGLMIIDQIDYSQEARPIVFRSAFLRIERLPN